MATVFADTGKAIVTGRLTGGAAPAQVEPNFCGIGSGGGTAAVGDTTLFTEFTTGTWSGYARANPASTRVTTALTNDTYRVQAAFTAPAGGPYTVTNAGLFDAASAGNLLLKGDFAGQVLNAGDTLNIDCKLQFTS